MGCIGSFGLVFQGSQGIIPAVECPSSNEWIKKLWYIYTMEFYTAEGKKKLIPFRTVWMELESIMLSEIIRQ